MTCAPDDLQSRTIEIGKRQVHVLEGDRSRGVSPPVFLIEAACGWHSEKYLRLLECLATRGHVIAYDRSGLGRSPVGGSCDGVTRARELHGLIEELGIEQPLVLIGHSIGALYLRVYAHAHAEKIAGLVLLDGTHPLVHKLLKRRTPVAERFRTLRARCALGMGAKGPHRSHITMCAELDLLALASTQATACGGLGSLPLLVVTAGRRTEDELRYTHDPESFMDIWMILQKDLLTLSTRATHRVIEEAGHCNLVTQSEYAERVCKEIASFVEAIQH